MERVSHLEHTPELGARRRCCATDSQLDEFLSEGLHSAATHKLADFMKGKRFTLGPSELVFREKFSSVVDARGKRVEKF